MTDARPRQAHELFLELVDLPTDERREQLAERCAGDSPLRAEVEELLRSDDAMPDSFLGGSASQRTDLQPGLVIAGYEIVGLLGEGGMGAVYEARQSAPLRRVALKVIRADRMSSEARRRLRQEAEVLGALQHAGIAQIYEAGAARVELSSGHVEELPFLAMELVPGVPLLEYAAGHSLSLRARIELVARTCDAVHHAHQRGFIHRDLKSDNVLVSDGAAPDDPQPKILDFGIARVVGDGERSSLTRIGQIVGTLGAMSPEQISGDHALDVRTDVYALGALLYELLAGRPPIEIADCTFPEAVRRVTHASPEPLGNVDADLRGDLTIIAGIALHKDKERRYQSAARLAEDLRRHLAGEPIRAREDSTWYVVGRVIRRHRVAAAALVGLLALGFAFAVVSGIQSANNRRLADSEARERTRAEAQLAVSNIERGRLFGANHNGLGADLIWREYVRDPSSPHAYWALWEFYSRNPCVATNLAHSDRARQVEVSPDGQWFASGDFSGEIVLWNASARELGRIAGAGSPVRAMSPAPGGKALAASYLDGTVALWDVSSRTPRWSRQVFEPNSRSQSAGGRSLCHDPTGELLVTTGSSGGAHVLEARTGDLLRTLEHEGRVWAVAFAANGGRMATSGSPEVRVWNVPSFELDAVFQGHERNTFACALSEHGDSLYTGGDDKAIIEWDVESTRVVQAVRPGNGWFRRLTWSADHGTLYANGLYRADALALPGLDVTSSTPFFSNATAGFAVFPDNSLVVTTDDSGTVRVWETAARAGRRPYGEHSGPVRSALAPDGTLLVTGDESGVLRSWNTITGDAGPIVASHLSPVRSLRFHPHRPEIAALGLDGRLRILDVLTGKIERQFEGCAGQGNRTIDFSPDGELIAAAAADRAFRVWGLHDGELQLELPIAPYEALSIAFAPDGKTLATVSRKEPAGATDPWVHRLDVWDMNGRRLASEESGPSWWTASFSADGQRIVGGTWDWDVGLWDWESGATSLLEGHEGTVWDARFLPCHPDLVASSSADGTVRLWSVGLMRNVLTLSAFEHSDVVSLSASADGSLLTAAGEMSEALVWDLTHFERHIAGNLEAQLARLEGELDGEEPRGDLERWAAEVLDRPWPRLVR